MNRQEAVDIVYTVVVEAIEAAIAGVDGYPIPAGTPVENVVAFRNNEFTEPQGVPWMTMEVDVVNQEAIGYGGSGNNLFQTEAELLMDIHAPLNKNMSANYMVAQTVINAVLGKTFGGVRFMEAYDQHVERTDEWEITQLTAAFMYDEESA